MNEPVPLDSWQVGPHNRWSYQHVGEVVPTVVVARGDGPVSELPARGVDLDDLVDGLVDAHFADGVAVLHHGALVYERYANDMGPETLHLSQSVGKSVVGLLAGILAGRGALDPASPVSDHVPELAGSGYEGATVQHLLDMTAAIDFVEEYAGEFWKYDAACGWHPGGPGAEAASILEYLPAIGPSGDAHGERFHYASPNTDLLGIVAERAGGAPLAEQIGRELWAPMGAERDAALTVDSAGTAVISGGFCATLRDYARMGQLVLEGGRGVVPADWIGQLGDGDPDAFACRENPAAGAGASGYRNKWWSRDGGVMARGIHGQMVAVDPRARVVVTVLSSWPDATDPAFEAAHRQLVSAVCDRLASPVVGD
jgi:CubicO group peptidase (beta-lactamase class C family)